MALTVTLNLSRAFVAPVNNPSGYVRGGTAGSLGGGGQRGDTITQDGEFRNYANGVTKLILGSARSRVQSFAIRAITQPQVDSLTNMIGQTCLFRDTYGRKIYGAFLSLSVVNIPLSSLLDVSIEFQQVTYNEAV